MGTCVRGDDIELHGIGCHEFGSWNAENKKRRRAYAVDLILFVTVLVLVLENQNFIGMRTTRRTKFVLCNRVWNFMKFHISAAAGRRSGQFDRTGNSKKRISNNECRMSNVEVMNSVYFKKD